VWVCVEDYVIAMITAPEQPILPVLLVHDCPPCVCDND
jgi:hypothetical protein